MDIVRLRAKTVEGVTVHPTFGEMNVISVFLVDQNNNRITDQMLRELHQQGRAVGYCVKIREEFLTDSDMPSLTTVHDVEPGRVSVGGLWMSLEDFHKYYEIDD
jgi:hypothetical protein